MDFHFEKRSKFNYAVTSFLDPDSSAATVGSPQLCSNRGDAFGHLLCYMLNQPLNHHDGLEVTVFCHSTMMVKLRVLCPCVKGFHTIPPLPHVFEIFNNPALHACNSQVLICIGGQTLNLPLPSKPAAELRFLNFVVCLRSHRTLLYSFDTSLLSLHRPFYHFSSNHRLIASSKEQSGRQLRVCC